MEQRSQDIIVHILIANITHLYTCASILCAGIKLNYHSFPNSDGIIITAYTPYKTTKYAKSKIAVIVNINILKNFDFIT